jgi:hypothetical protein
MVKLNWPADGLESGARGLVLEQEDVTRKKNATVSGQIERRFIFPLLIDEAKLFVKIYKQLTCQRVSEEKQGEIGKIFSEDRILGRVACFIET